MLSQWQIWVFSNVRLTTVWQNPIYKCFLGILCPYIDMILFFNTWGMSGCCSNCFINVTMVNANRNICLLKNGKGGGVQTSRAITLTGNYAININMADEKSPLLQSTDEDEGPRLRHHHAFPTTHRSTDLSPVTSTEADHIVCVFVVTFDTRSGKTTIRCQHK